MLNKVTESRITEIYTRQVHTVWRVCYSFMQNPHDTDDMVQETFVKLMTKGPVFDDVNHERGWLIVTASNLCRDALKAKARQHENLDDHRELAADEPVLDDLLSMILKLKDNYKTVLYLFYYEGYQITEIADLLRISVPKVKTTLHRARKKLKAVLEDHEESEDH